MNPSENKNTEYIDYKSISIAEGMKAPPRNSYLCDEIDRIKNGSNGLKQKIEKLNNLYITDNTKNKKKYTELKNTLPVFMASGIFKGNKSAKSLQHHSGNILLDFDHMQDAQEFKIQVCKDPNTLAVFTSPSGNGMKVICKVNPIPNTPPEHIIAWKAVAKFYEKYGKASEGVDGTGKNVNRLCYLSYDPTVYYNPQSKTLSWEYTEQEKEKEQQKTADKREQQKLREQQEKARQQEQKIITKLKKKGHKLNQPAIDALDAFFNTDTHTIFVSWNIGIHTGNNQYRHPESDSGDRSFVIEEGILKPYSESAQKYNPNDDKTEPVNAHRYAAFMRFGLDLTKKSDIRQLKIELSNLGYGTHPEEYDNYRKEFERIARKEGLLKKTYTPKKKLTNDTEKENEDENINVLRLQNDERFKAWLLRTQTTGKQHILIIATAAGTGKTTLTILKIDKSVDVSPITELADAKFETAISKGRHAVRHRPRHYNRQNGNKPHTTPLGLYGGDTVPCVFPDHCNALAQKGYNPITTFCSRCTRKTECEESGYLSQYRTLQQYDQIFVAWNEGIMTDPHSRKYIKSLTENGDYVGVLDEVDPADLCPQRSYTTRLLEKVYDEFRDVDCDTAPFLRKFIRETSTATSEIEWTNTVRTVLDDYEKETLNLIDDELQRIPVTVKFAAASNPPQNLENRGIYKHVAHITFRNKTITCAVLTEPADSCFIDDNKWILKNEIMPKSFNYTHETARLISVNTFIRLNFVSLDTPESINLLPRRLQDFTQDLQSFVDSLDGETPPAQRTADGWDYYLLPSLNMRRVVFISASGVDEHIRELYKHTEIDIETLDGNPPAWKTGCKLYQISTGRYTPNKSLIEKDPTTRTPTGLKPRAVEMINIIERVATAAVDKKILVVAPDAFTKDGALAHITELKTLHELPNVSVVNHAHAEGVNSYEDHEISFVFSFEIPPDEVKRIAKCIYRTETLSFEREKTNVTKGGVTLDDVERYTDERVQSIHDKECEKTLMQAITRQRQMLHENRTCYLFTSEPIGGLPTTPILFTLGDMFTCLDEQENLDKLDTFLEQQAERTVTEIAEQDDITKRTAYRKTEKQRKKEKENTAAKIIQLYDEQLSERENAKRLGISRGKLQSILKI